MSLSVRFLTQRLHATNRQLTKSFIAVCVYIVHVYGFGLSQKSDIQWHNIVTI